LLGPLLLSDSAAQPETASAARTVAVMMRFMVVLLLVEWVRGGR